MPSYFMDKDSNIYRVPTTHIAAIQAEPEKYGLTKEDVVDIYGNGIIGKVLGNGFVRIHNEKPGDWNIQINGMWSKAYYAALSLGLEFNLDDDTVFTMENQLDKTTRTLTLDHIKSATDSGTVASLRVAMKRLKWQVSVGDTLTKGMRRDGYTEQQIRNALLKAKDPEEK